MLLSRAALACGLDGAGEEASVFFGGAICFRCWLAPAKAYASTAMKTPNRITRFMNSSVGKAPRILPFCKWISSNEAAGFLDPDDLVSGNVCKTVDLPAGPADFDGVGLRVSAEPEGEDKLARREIA